MAKVWINGVDQGEPAQGVPFSSHFNNLLDVYRAGGSETGEILGGSALREVRVEGYGPVDLPAPLNLTRIRREVLFDFGRVEFQAKDTIGAAAAAVCLLDSSDLTVRNLRLFGEVAGMGVLEGRANESGNRSAGKHLFEDCKVTGNWKLAGWANVGGEASVAQNPLVENGNPNAKAAMALLGDNSWALPPVFGLTPGNGDKSESTYKVFGGQYRATAGGAEVAPLLVDGFDAAHLVNPTLHGKRNAYILIRGNVNRMQVDRVFCMPVDGADAPYVVWFQAVTNVDNIEITTSQPRYSVAPVAADAGTYTNVVVQHRTEDAAVVSAGAKLRRCDLGPCIEAV